MVTVLTVIINTLARQRRDPGAIGAGGGGGCGVVVVVVVIVVVAVIVVEMVVAEILEGESIDDATVPSRWPRCLDVPGVDKGRRAWMNTG